MASTKSILYTLPSDIFNEIISWLDPISLIGFSQASKALRGYVNPTEWDFQQRLLALELLPEYGGPEPDYKPGRDVHAEINYRGATRWAKNKYACCGCMKILPHFMFDDGALFSKGTRKPFVSGPETQRMVFTSWKPTATTEGRMSMIQRQAMKFASAAEQYERRYDESHNWFENAWEPDRITREALKAEHLQCFRETTWIITGRARHERRCIECKFQQQGYTNLLCGNPNAPIVTCYRSENMRLTFNWLFPGLLPKMRMPKFKSRLSRMNPGNRWLTSTTWDFRAVDEPEPDGTGVLRRTGVLRIRCPGCDKWQKSRAFGITLTPPDTGFYNPRSTLIQMDQTSPLCHCCHLDTHGKAPTAERLAGLALDMLDVEVKCQFGALVQFWRSGIYIIRSLLVTKGQEGTWNKIATLNADPHLPVESALNWYESERDIYDWEKELVLDLRLAGVLKLRHLPVLLARIHLIRETLAPILRDLEANPTLVAELPDDVGSQLFWLVPFLHAYETVHHSIVDMQAAYDNILRAKSAGDHDFLIHSLLVQDKEDRISKW